MLNVFRCALKLEIFIYHQINRFLQLEIVLRNAQALKQQHIEASHQQETILAMTNSVATALQVRIV